ncbi:MAG: hypothetical protein IJV37_07675 [Bacteroidales bacterium]|nr:hypothetical protein [Bacteroidales bacterium]
MKRLTTLSLIALAAAAMIAIPVDAQTRGGSSSRSGSGGSSSRSSSGGSRPSSSMSSQSRGHSSAGNTKGLGSAQRSSQPSYSSHSSSQPSRPSGSSQVSRSGSNSRSSSSVTRQTPSVGSSTKSSGTTVRQQTPSAGTQSRTAQPARSGSNVRSSSNGGTVVRQNRVDPGQPGGSINRNQPQPGMSVNSGAPRTVRSRTSAPRNFNGGIGPSHVQMHPGPGHNMERIPPYRRDPMPYGRAVRFWDGGHHYFGYRVSYLPPRYERRVYWGVPYYCLDGIYYRHYNGYYYVSRPPFGVYFDPVLDGVIYNACRFSYYYNVYNTYRTIDENARIIASQNETIAANNATIARQNADIALNTERAAKSFKEADRLGLVQSYADAGVEYFYQDGVFFIKNSEGKYVTIVPPAGALVQELPDDYETIVLEGEEYYKVDDTVYRLTIVDGSPYFEVLGQMTGQLAEKYNQYNTL